MTKEKVGRYEFLSEPFHCDFTHRLSMGHLGNHLLNAADFHSAHRGFGMPYLNPIHKTWVLSRLAIDMLEMPEQYAEFSVETWVESAMRYFTKRNFRITDREGGKVYGYARSIWAMIDTDTRQPQNILEVRDGSITDYIEKDKPCPIAELSRVQMTDKAEFVRSVDTYYSDVDVNGHINSIKYIEHVLDLFTLDWYREHRLKRFEIAYVAESHSGDKLNFYLEKTDGDNCFVRITKVEPDAEKETEVCRSKIEFVKD